MTIHLLGPSDDLARLAVLHAACFSDAWDARAIGKLLAAAGAFGFASASGFILVRAATDEAEILTLAVTPTARRNGLGIALVTGAANHAQLLGAAALFLEAAITNAAALALYKRLGFTEVGRRKGYYASRGAKPQDAVVLRSNLPLSPLGKRAADG